MYLSSSSRTFTSRRSFKYSQIRCCSIFKGIYSFNDLKSNPESGSPITWFSKIFKVLPNDPSARRLFVTSGGLKKIQELKPEPGSALKEHINNINACFPEEIVRYYTPGYSEQLLQRVDTYKPSDHTGTSFMNNHYSNSLFISPTSWMLSWLTNLFMKDGKGQSMTDEMNYEMAENIDYSERDLE